MICVECTNPEITCLYSEYKSKYIQLTVCRRCGKFADRYIEFDNVIIFLDLLLLRPQAYRHVAFNIVEESIFKLGTQGRFTKYRKLVRFIVLSILFEVYLKWAYEEKSETHTLLKSQVLGWLPVWQYLFFVCQQLTEKAIFFTLVLILFIKVMGWGKVPIKNLEPRLWGPYYICVLILTLLMSLSVKCLPILMLIWPYDNAAVASVVVDVLGAFNTIEALHMNTNCSYLSTVLIISTATVMLICGKQLVTSLIVAAFSPGFPWTEYLRDENEAFMLRVRSMVASVFFALG